MKNFDIESPPKHIIDDLDIINFTSIDIKETDEDNSYMNNLNQLKIQKVFSFFLNFIILENKEINLQI